MWSGLGDFFPEVVETMTVDDPYWMTVSPTKLESVREEGRGRGSVREDGRGRGSVREDGRGRGSVREDGRGRGRGQEIRQRRRRGSEGL